MDSKISNNTLDLEARLKKIGPEILKWLTEVTQKRGSINKFVSWLESTESPNRNRIKKQSYYNYFNGLKDFYNYYQVDGQLDSDIGTLKIWLDYFEAIQEELSSYLAFLNERQPEKTMPLSPSTDNEQEIDSRIMQPGKWFFYFLNVAERKKKLVGISRAVLTIENNHSVTLKNIGGQFGGDYFGSYEKIEDSTVFFFNLSNLKNQETKKKGDIIRQLHFKVYYLRETHDILLGAYTTFDTFKIYSGSFVMEKIEDSFPSDKIVPLSIHRKKNPQDYSLIDKRIQNFLAIKIRNYYLLPQPVGNLDGLETLLEPISIMHNSDSRFFDFPVSRMFVACPSTSSNESEVERESIKIFKKALNSTFKDQLDIHPKEDKSWNDLQKFMNLSDLTRTKFFLMLITKTNKASYSMLELGCALRSCQFIIIVYKKDSISDRLRTFGEMEEKIYMIDYNSLSDHKDVKKILDKIQDFVKFRNLSR